MHISCMFFRLKSTYHPLHTDQTFLKLPFDMLKIWQSKLSTQIGQVLLLLYSELHKPLHLNLRMTFIHNQNTFLVVSFLHTKKCTKISKNAHRPVKSYAQGTRLHQGLKKVDMKTLVSKFSVACHHLSGK